MKKQKVFRTGNSLAVTIPSNFANSIGVRPGNRVTVTPDPQKGQVTYRFDNIQQLPLDDSFLSRRKKR